MKRFVLFSVLAAVSLSAQVPGVDNATIAKIRGEAMTASQAMDTHWWLSEGYEPRATVTQNGKTGSGTLNGTLDGDQVSFRFSLTACANGCPVEGSVQLAGNQLTGTYTATNEQGQARSGLYHLQNFPLDQGGESEEKGV